MAQGSLGTVSTAIDEIGSSVLKGTAQIISQGKEAILAIDQESDSSSSNSNSNVNYTSSGQQKKYSRFDAQVRALQGDVNTYCEEVDDVDDYKKWKSGFALDSVSEEIDSLFEENGAIENIYKRVVPSSVDHETFWCRYFYRLFKLKQAEDLRANLVKRAISREEDDDELSWDVDEEDEESEINVAEKVSVKNNTSEAGTTSAHKDDANVNAEVSGKESTEKVVEEESSGDDVSKSENVVKGNAAESSEEKIDGGNSEESVGVNPDEKVSSAKTDPSESSKGSDFSVVSSQPSMQEEEDLEWDEIEDLTSIDDKKATRSNSPNRAELRKRLSTAEEDEDLSWDIEDEEEPVKS